MKKILNLGTEYLEPLKTAKIQMTNAVVVITCAIAMSYTGYFYFSLGQPVLAIGQFSFVIAYGLTLIFIQKRLYRVAKTWFFLVLMGHVFALSFFVFKVGAGFHFYYLILPSGLFLLFDHDDKYEKLLLCLIGGILFFICDNHINLNPYIELSESTEKLLYSSVIIVTLSEVYFIMALLSSNIDAYEKELKSTAETDALTGINNRRIFMAVGHELFENAKRYSKPLTLLLFDIDHFKCVNDDHGHIVGDQVLKKIASVLQTNLRASDTLARYGGEEFVVVLPETNISAAEELAQNLRKAVADIKIDVTKSQPLSITTSIGVAQYNSSVNSLMQLLDHADKALYQAKVSGRNQVVLYDSTR